MRGGEHEVARAYVLYREKRSQERATQKAQAKASTSSTTIHVVENGVRKPLDLDAPDRARASESCDGPAPTSSPSASSRRRCKDLYDGVPMEEVRKCVVLAGAHADREGPRVQLRDRAPAARRAALRGARRGSHAGRHGGEVRRVLPALRQARREDRPAQRGAAAVRHGASSARRSSPSATCSSATSACRRSTTATSSSTSTGARQRRPPLRAAAVLLHARRDGPRAERGRPRGARDRVLQRAVDVRLHVEHADAVQLGHASLAAVVVLPDDGVRRPRRHLRGDQGKRAAVQVRRRTRQRLDQRARDGLAHQGHQRQVAGRGAVPQGRQRHGGRGEPGRQAQGRGLHVPRDLAPRHRGVPRAAQEHRRRPPPHARHEHGELDSRPVHEARDRRRRLDAVLARPTCPTCTTSGATRSRRRTTRYEAQGRARRAQAVQEDPRGAAVAEDAVDAVRDRASVDHVQGRVQRALAAAARRHRAQQQPVHRDHAQHERDRDRRVQPGLGEPARAHEADRDGDGWRWELDHAKLQRTIRTAMRMLDNVIDINYYAVEEGARQQPASTARWAWASWASRTACT